MLSTKSGHRETPAVHLDYDERHNYASLRSKRLSKLVLTSTHTDKATDIPPLIPT